MSAAEFWEGVKYVVGVVIGVGAGKYGGKILDWLRGYKQDRAEVEKTLVEKDSSGTVMALSIAKEAREQLKASNEEIEKLRKVISDMWEKIDVLTKARFEERQRCAQLEDELNKLKLEMKKHYPDDRRAGRL